MKIINFLYTCQPVWHKFINIFHLYVSMLLHLTIVQMPGRGKDKGTWLFVMFNTIPNAWNVEINVHKKGKKARPQVRRARFDRKLNHMTVYKFIHISCVISLLIFSSSDVTVYDLETSIAINVRAAALSSKQFVDISKLF